MLREHRSSPAAQRAVHGKSNQLSTNDTAGPAANENASPNHNSNERIKAWKGLRTSAIPTAPSPTSEAVAVTPKQVPLGTTPANERVTTLQAIKNHLQDRLESERQLQIDAVKQLEYIGDKDERSIDLNNEVCSRGNKIMILSQKLTRTQHTLGSLQRATDEYEASAQKVKNAEQMYKSRQRKSSGLNLTLKESKSIRHELDAATSMMNAACQRVEQIESITDNLINQLSETENELADLQHLRNTELVKHSAEIEKLAHERDCLAMQLAVSNSSSDELKQKEQELNQKLLDAKSTAKKLVEELKKADDAKAAQEESLKKEADRLQMSLEETERRKVMLEKELQQKQNDLEDAQKRALQGTPKSKGAKQVLPMALRKLKGTQEELMSVKEEKERAMKDLEYAKQLAKAREETFMEQLKIQTDESNSALNEKQSALESVMKAAAATANDVAVKQEVINNLRMDIAQIKESKDQLLCDMEVVKKECEELSQKLTVVSEQESNSRDAIAQMKKRHNDLQASALEREIVLKTQLEESNSMASDMQAKVSSLEKEYAVLLKAKQQFEKQLGSKDASIASLNAKIASQEEKSKTLQAIMGKDLKELKENVECISQEKSKVERDLRKTHDTIKSLHYEVATLQAEKNEISGLLDAKESEIVSLTKNYASQIHDLKATVQLRDAKISELEMACSQKDEHSTKLIKDMEALTEEHKKSHQASQQMIQNLTDNLKNAENKYSELQVKYSKLEETGHEQLISASKEIASLKQQFLESEQMRKTLEETFKEEKMVHSSERRQLLEQCENLERSKESLMRSIQQLDEQLVVKEEELVASKSLGTPRGEAAKEILQRSLAKVKALQKDIADLNHHVRIKDERIAELEQENLQIHVLKSDSSKLQAEIGMLNILQEETGEKLAKAENTVKLLEQEISKVHKKLCEEIQAKSQLESVLESKMADWESKLSHQQEQYHNLELQKQQAQHQVKCLTANLNETKQVLVGMRKREDSGEEVMRLTFEKVKSLEHDIAEKEEESAKLAHKLEIALATESMLQEAIDEASNQHALTIASYDKAINSLEANIARLREELLTEINNSQALLVELDTVRSENIKLEESNEKLQSTVDEIKCTMQTFENEVEQKQKDLDKVQAEKDSLIAEMVEKVSAAEKQKDLAQQAVDRTTEEVDKVTKNLAIAKSQLSSFERSMTAKETTISTQKKMIKDMEDQASKLREEIQNSTIDLQSRDLKLKQLGQAKINVELQLGQHIKELKEKLEVEKEKNERINLADAAAQNSAQILEQTQMRLAESEKSVRFLVNATKSMSSDLKFSQDLAKKKSDEIAELLEQLKDQAELAQRMEDSFIKKQDELQKALTSAEWLASVTKSRYENQIEELTHKVETLERRCEHMEILERQNMELCAIARDRLHTPVELESHRVKDVDTTTSPPSNSGQNSVGAKTAMAAMTAAAGFAIMSCATRSSPQ